MTSGMTRREFMLGPLLLVALGGVHTVETLCDDEDMELCVLRCSGVLSFSEAWKRDISGGKGGWMAKSLTESERDRLESDYLEGLAEGDVLQVGRVDLSMAHSSGIGDTGLSSLSSALFSEVEQAELLESVMSEAVLGTDMYATVLKVFSLPGIDWHRNVWLSIRAVVTPENADRLKRIASSRCAAARMDEYKSDVETYRVLSALSLGGSS